MKKKAPGVILLAVIALLALGVSACKKEARMSRMLLDKEAKATEEDRALATEKKPRLFPAEPFPSVEAGEARSSAMLRDLEGPETKEALPPSERDQRPRPLPEEPKPAAKATK